MQGGGSVGESVSSVPVRPPQAPEGEGPAPGGAVPFPSPLVGTFYRASSPDADPFVEVGAKVGPDSVLCIIEAMKVMNEIKAETRAEVVEILVENGEPVEYGQPLFLLKPL
jgi:acetyl-CoA carboxylase biotin carboxyl carrier protein